MNYVEDFKKIYCCEAPSFLPDNLKKRLSFLSCLSEKEERSVYLVKDQNHLQKCVLKITQKQSSDSAKSEYTILHGLDHEGIPKALHYQEDDLGREYLLRSYMEGDPLNLLLERDGVFEEEQVYDIILKICAILRYLHSQSPPIIYRDIHPANITLTPNKKVSLIDFGISKKIPLNNQSLDTVMIGTLPFISPEQMGYGRTDHRTDIFSLGKLMLYLCTGQTEAGGLYGKNATPLDKIIRKCTHQAKEKRFSSIKSLENAIKWAQHKPIQAAYQKALALVAALLLVMGGLWGMHQATRPPQKAVLPAVLAPGPVEEGLPITTAELIRAAREALELPEETSLSKTMLGQITALTLDGFVDEPPLKTVNKPQLSSQCLQELSHFKALRALTISGYHIVDCSPLESLALTTLTLTNNSLVNISPLSKMLSLTRLNLSGNPIDDIRPLAALKQLTNLNLSFTAVRSLSPLEKLLNLQELSLRAALVTDFTPLTALESLTTLSISHVQIKDFSFLKNLHKLTHLELKSTGFYDLAMIQSPFITYLDISLNYNFITDLRGLANFPKLLAVDITLNNIVDYSPLYDAANLQTVGIHDSQYSKLFFQNNSFGQMPHLKKLTITTNTIDPSWDAFGEENQVAITYRPYYSAY